MNKIDMCLSRFIMGEKRKRTQINKRKSRKGEVIMDTTEIQRVIRDYYKQLYASIMESLEEMEKFLERYSLPRLSQEEIENMTRLITSTKIEMVIKNVQQAKVMTRKLHMQIISNIKSLYLLF